MFRIHFEDIHERAWGKAEAFNEGLEGTLTPKTFASLGIDVGEEQIDLSLCGQVEAFSFFDDITNQGMIAFTASFLIGSIGITKEDPT